MMYAALEEQYAASEGHALSFTTSSSATSSQQYVSRYGSFNAENVVYVKMSKSRSTISI